jgi:DNA-binding NarL/FixJ family response regulator
VLSLDERLQATPRRTAGAAVLDVRDTTLRLALTFVLESAGWLRVEPGATGMRVSDSVPGDGATPPVDVLVVSPTPAGSRLAMRAFASGDVRAVLSTHDPEQLPATLELLQQGLSVVPVSIVEAANRVPTLSSRLERTLQLVMGGQSNRSIARVLQQSEATAKRDVAELLRIFDAANRQALSSTASRLGYAAR